MNRFNVLIVSLLVVAGGVSTELILREKYGFGNAPLYAKSDTYEYMAKPNQSGKRFGNAYYYNAFAQRSEEVSQTKPKILGLGDSVLFGGVLTDQADLATSLVSDETSFQMLNISAGSWGADNCAAYLMEQGIFDARAMILVISSHDAHDNMDFQPVVGVHKSYPNKQYALAWFEVLHRYVFPRIGEKFKKKAANVDPDQAVLQGITKSGKEFNPGFEQLRAIAEENDIPFVIYLHAERGELAVNKYNNQGDKIIDWALENNITLIKGLDYQFTKDDYIDGIHINQCGQRKLADIIENDILPNLKI